MKKWLIYQKKADFAAIADKFNITPYLARIIVNRGVKDEAEIAEYLYGGKDSFFDPFLLEDMRKAVCLAADVINSNGKIRIIGDYDADGVCSAFILESAIKALGGQADVRLPNRFKDGYGMNVSMARECGKDGIALIITCDNGIAAAEPVREAKALGISVIVTDHHVVPEELPPADAVIDPKRETSRYPFRELCGAGVAYKFAQALCGAKDENGEPLIKNQTALLKAKELLPGLLQYAGIATITDIVPLLGENRAITKAALFLLRHTDNPGLLALCRQRGIEPESLNAYQIGFVIGPCINAAGRLEDATLALDLLRAAGGREAEALAERLSDLNEERKSMTADEALLASDALKRRAEEEGGVLKERVAVAYIPGGSESVAGIVAGRIREEFERPAIIITDSAEGLKGSGRSCENYNMIENISRFPELFSKFGGHAAACGFTLKKGITADDLSRELNRNYVYNEDDFNLPTWIDMRLPLKEATERLCGELSLLEPFGVGNEEPVFAEKNVKILSERIVGKNSGGLKMRLEGPCGTCLEGLLFKSSEQVQALYREIKAIQNSAGKAPEASILYFPKINEFRGMKTVELFIKDIRVHN